MSFLNNLVPAMVAFHIFLFIAFGTAKTSTQLKFCLISGERLCYECDNINRNKLYCDEMPQNVINMELNSTKITDYNSIKYTNIKVIIQPDRVTYYSCNKNEAYLQVNSSNYYPLDRKLNFTNHPLNKPTRYADLKFQSCLNNYCANMANTSNKFICNNYLMEHLHFMFSTTVTPYCIQNITYVDILSRRITELCLNRFFINAYNIIYLNLEIDSLKIFECNALKNLKNLRVLHLNVPIRLRTFECFFHYNPTLALININKLEIWNPCHPVTSEDNEWNHQLVVPLLSVMLAVIVFFMSYKCYHRILNVINDKNTASH